MLWKETWKLICVHPFPGCYSIVSDRKWHLHGMMRALLILLPEAARLCVCAYFTATESAEIAHESNPFVDLEGFNKNRVILLCAEINFGSSRRLNMKVFLNAWTGISCYLKMAGLCRCSSVGVELCLPQGHRFCWIKSFWPREASSSPLSLIPPSLSSISRSLPLLLLFLFFCFSLHIPFLLSPSFLGHCGCSHGNHRIYVCLIHMRSINNPAG